MFLYKKDNLAKPFFEKMGNGKKSSADAHGPYGERPYTCGKQAKSQRTNGKNTGIEIYPGTNGQRSQA
jgi:hypothetical protein